MLFTNAVQVNSQVRTYLLNLLYNYAPVCTFKLRQKKNSHTSLRSSSTKTFNIREETNCFHANPSCQKTKADTVYEKILANERKTVAVKTQLT